MSASAATVLSRDALVDTCAGALVQSFADYNAEYRSIPDARPSASRIATGVAACATRSSASSSTTSA